LADLSRIATVLADGVVIEILRRWRESDAGGPATGVPRGAR